MKDHVSAISLRLRHPQRDVRDLLEGWGLDAGGSWVAGEKRTTPKGAPLEGVWPDSYAFARLPSEGARLSQCLNRVLAVLEPFSNELAAFVQAGGRAELFVGWHFDANSGDVLESSLLRRLSDCGLDLSLDVYPKVEPEMKELAHGRT